LSLSFIAAVRSVRSLDSREDVVSLMPETLRGAGEPRARTTHGGTLEKCLTCLQFAV